MAVVSDFTTILADTQQTEVLGQDFTSAPGDFNTGGRHAPGTAYISFMVQGLTTNSANVFVNDKHAGALLPNDGHWTTQTVTLKGSLLDNGDNVLRVSHVAGDPFLIRSVICHFKQDVN